MDKTSKIKISVSNTSTKSGAVRTVRRPMMDFAPAKNSKPHRVAPKVTDAELARREIARAEVRRREEIHRQIQSQNEADIVAHHRADAARRELARQRAVEEEASRVRSEKEIARAEALRLERAHARAEERLERAAAEERKRLVARRRAEAARRELARRQAADMMKRSNKVVNVKNPASSSDPIAKKVKSVEEDFSTYNPVLPTPTPKRQISVKADDESRRIYGKVSEPAAHAMTRAERDYRALHPELVEEPRKSRRRSLNPSDLGDVNDFATEVGDDDATMGEIEDIESIEENLEEVKDEPVEEDTSENNYRYILGGRSPFINTEKVVKRPLSGNSEGIAADKLQRPGARLTRSKTLLGGPNVGDYVSPAEDPRARERARREMDLEEYRKKHPELLDDNLATNPRYVPYEEPIPHKNLYARRKEAMKKEKKDDIPTMVVADGDKGTGMALAFVVFLTIILGAIVGIIAYLAFFQ